MPIIECIVESITYRNEENGWTVARVKSGRDHFAAVGGILLALYFLFTLVYPFFKMRDRITMIYIALIIILFISALTEDTLETQTGRLLFCVFVPLLLHANLTPEKKSEEQGSASPEKSC